MSFELPHPSDPLSQYGAANRTANDLATNYEDLIHRSHDAVEGYAGLQVICAQAIARCALLEADLTEARRGATVIPISSRTRKATPAPVRRPGA